MTVAFRISDGRDLDQIYARRVSPVIYGALSMRYSDSNDLINVFENRRVSGGGVITQFRASNGQDFNDWCTTTAGTPIAFTGNTTSGPLPSGGGLYGDAYVDFRPDGYYQTYGTWQGVSVGQWHSNPSAGIGATCSINVQKYSTPTACHWGGTYNTWLNLGTTRTFNLGVTSPNSGSFTAALACYFAYSGAEGSVLQNNTFNFTANGRFKDLG